MTPRILISGSNESRFFYEDAVRRCGGDPVSCYLPDADGSFDGLLLAGGCDVSPARYGEENTASEEPDLARDQAEFTLFQKYLELGKPILGICRGMQLLNVALGGSLQQDIGRRLRLIHSDRTEPDYRVHPILAAEGSLLFRAYGDSFPVNSMHHQALDRLGRGLKAVAWSESGIVEAVEHSSLPILGVQFHPERMCFDRRRPDAVDGQAIFHWLMEEAGK